MGSGARFVGRGGLAVSCLLVAASCSGTPDDSRSRDALTSGQAGSAGQAGVSMLGGNGGASGTPAGANGSSGSKASPGSGGTNAASAGRGASAAGSSAAGRAAAGASGSAGTAGRPSSGSSGNSGAAGASPATGELFADDFEDGDLTKPSWIDADAEVMGMWAVATFEGRKVLAQTASVSDWVIAVAGDYRWGDQVVEAKVQFTSEPGKAGVFARVRDLENYYFLYLDGGSNIVLRKRVDNSSSDVMKVKVETMQGVWYTLRLSVRGETLEGYLDGKLLVSASDAGVKTGGVGVGTADCTAQFDDVVVRN